MGFIVKHMQSRKIISCNIMIFKHGFLVKWPYITMWQVEHETPETRLLPITEILDRYSKAMYLENLRKCLTSFWNQAGYEFSYRQYKRWKPKQPFLIQTTNLKNSSILYSYRVGNLKFSLGSESPDKKLGGSNEFLFSCNFQMCMWNSFVY